MGKFHSSLQKTKGSYILKHVETKYIKWCTICGYDYFNLFFKIKNPLIMPLKPPPSWTYTHSCESVVPSLAPPPAPPLPHMLLLASSPLFWSLSSPSPPFSFLNSCLQFEVHFSSCSLNLFFISIYFFSLFLLVVLDWGHFSLQVARSRCNYWQACLKSTWV